MDMLSISDLFRDRARIEVESDKLSKQMAELEAKFVALHEETDRLDLIIAEHLKANPDQVVATHCCDGVSSLPVDFAVYLAEDDAVVCKRMLTPYRLKLIQQIEAA